MNINVITGPQASGKTTKLRTIQDELKHQGAEVKIHVGEYCTTPYFMNLVADQAMAGAKHFLADDCTQFQIRALFELKSKGIHAGVPTDFEVHLVRKA